jgi:hypothetical protein
MRALIYYEPTATWTDEIGAKTKKLWAKQDCRDLSKINYRLQGLAEKKLETQQTVLVNRSKIRVRTEKEPRDGFGWKESKDLGFYMKKMQGTKTNLWIKGNFRGLLANRPTFISYLWTEMADG